MPTRPFRRALLVWPYFALWAVVAAAVGGYAWHEIAATRLRDLAEGRVEAENLARVLQEQLAGNLDAFERTLGLLKNLYERTPGGISLHGVTDGLNVAPGSVIERRVVRYDREGHLVDATDIRRPLPAVSAADRPWFVLARDRPTGRMTIGEPGLGRLSGILSIPLVMRLDSREGGFDGVLVTSLDPRRLVELFRSIRVGDRSTVGIADRSGKVYVVSLASGIPSSDAPGPATMRELIGDESVASQAGIPGTDLVAFAVLSTEQVLGDQRRDARSIIGFALLTLVGLTVPIVVVAYRFAREAVRRGRLEIGIEAERQNARTDPLTEAANRRAFVDRLAQCHADLRDHGHAFVLAIIDVDRFKQLNDTQGHAVGDRALRTIARVLMGGVRRSDLVARLGGDEFAILMPHTDAQSMRRPFDAMYTAMTVAAASEGWPIGFSMGVIAFEGPVERPQDASHLADRLMYAVKTSGRDGVRFAIYREQRLHPEPPGGDASEDIATL